MRTVTFEVTELNVYPVKSCRGTSLSEAQIDARGIRHDRSWVLVSDDGIAITQREIPPLSLVSADIIDDQTMRFRAPSMPELIVHKNGDGKLSNANIWGDDCRSVDQGDEPANWFGKYMGVSCRLLTMADDFVRPVEPKLVKGDYRVGFADSHPFVLISQASLDDLNQRLDVAVPMNRFRPNIVVTGCSAFAEDDWKRIRIGQIEFVVSKPCARCVMITIDQDKAELSKEPMKTLAGYRTVGKKVMFGQNLVHESQGVIKLGEPVEVLS